MSRKNRNQDQGVQKQDRPPSTPVAPGRSRRGLVIAAGAALAVAAGSGALVYTGNRRHASQLALAANRPGLASEHAPSIGETAAKVHVVEFLDPACETCSAFYPIIKQIMADNPGRIRLSIRHLPLHKGSFDVVRFLEASRKQGRYWQTLEALLATQALWVVRHVASPEAARQAIAGVGLNMDQLMADIQAPEVAQRMERDRSDATTLDVNQTPEYFVNGRQMPSFGRQQLQDLVRDALRGAY